MTTLDRDTVAFLLWFHDYWYNESDEELLDIDPETYNTLYIKWKTEWLSTLNEPHNGDCIKVPAPCTRCHTEDILNKADRIITKIDIVQNRLPQK